MKAAEFLAEGAVPTEVALISFYFRFRYAFESWPLLFFGLFGVRGGDGNEDVEKVRFGTKDVIRGAGDPAVVGIFVR